jgi:hypothetical protein
MRFACIATLISVSALSILSARDATACGGCFHEPPPPSEPTMTSVVTGHRMAISISPDRTVLWDQVQFAGDPLAFAWVLPVGKGATLELSNDAFFDALEGFTRERISSNVIDCPGTSGSAFAGSQSGAPSSSPGCGAFPVDASGDVGAGGGGGGGSGGTPATRLAQGHDGDAVNVIHQGTVGPYETVTLEATDALNLRTWLTSHGYVIPPDIDPVLGDYIAAGSSFIALRLAPGAGVRQMQPVRVITPGASPVLPLRMVRAGTGDTTSIVLYVIGEGRYAAKDFPTASIDPAELTWNWSSQSSNYAALREQALAGGGFLTSWARGEPFDAPETTPDGIPASFAAPQRPAVETLSDLYFSLGESLGADVGLCAGSAAPYGSSEKVVDACNDASCASSPLAQNFECGAMDDLGVALLGLHPSSVMLTRLEAELPRASLDHDLELTASFDQGAVGSLLQARKGILEPSCPTAPQATGGGAVADDPTPPRSACSCTLPSGRRRGTAGIGVAVVLAAALTRRLLARRPRR